MDIKQDLVEFTGLAPDEVERLLKRQGYTARDEFSDCIDRENCDHWFYLGSRYFLFENAIHSNLIEDSVRNLIAPGAQIWEFGGGTGNLSLTLAAAGYKVSYTELNSLQKDFVEFRVHKYGLPIQIIDFWQDKPKGMFDLVLALDVLEHIPDYDKVLAELCESVKQGGLIWETSAFEKDATNPCHRIHDSYDYKKILMEHHFSRVFGVQSGKLWKKVTHAEQMLSPKTAHLLSVCDINSAIPADSADIGNVRYWLIRGLEELTAGNYGLSLDYFEDAHCLDAAITAKCLVHALLSMNLEDLTKVESASKEALDKEPCNCHNAAESILVYHLKTLRRMSEGIVKLKTGDACGAMSLFNEVVEVCPQLPNLHFAIATACAQLGRLYSAKQACEEELKLRSEHSGARELLERINKAIDEYETGCRSDVCLQGQKDRMLMTGEP